MAPRQYQSENLVFKDIDELIEWIMEHDALKETLFDKIDDEFYGDDDE